MPLSSRIVNYWLIYQALGYLVSAEAENGKPLNLDPDDEACTKRIFCEYVRPEVERWPLDRIDRLKLSLAYFVHHPAILEFHVLANEQDLTMKRPRDISSFFLWLWEVLSPGERIEQTDLSGVVENNEIMDINRW